MTDKLQYTFYVLLYCCAFGRVGLVAVHDCFTFLCYLQDMNRVETCSAARLDVPDFSGVLLDGYRYACVAVRPLFNVTQL